MDYRPMGYSLPNPNPENVVSSSGKIFIFTWEINQTIFTVFSRVILTPLLSIRKINHLESLKDISLVHQQDFPGGSEGKASVYNAGDLDSIPGSGRSPGEGNGYPLQYSCLEKSMDREPRGVQSIGSQRAIHDWVTNTFTYFHILSWGQFPEGWCLRAVCLLAWRSSLGLETTNATYFVCVCVCSLSI